MNKKNLPVEDNLDEVAPGMITDISQRKRADEALRKANEKIRTIYNSITGHLTVVDRNYRIVNYNLTVERQFGKDLIGKVCYEVYQARKEVCSGCAVKKTLETGKPAFTFQPATPLSNPVDIYTYPIFDEKGEIVAVTEHGIEVTERVKAEKALRQTEEKFFKAFHATPDAIEITRVSDQRLIDVNEVFVRHSGYSRDQVVGHTTLEFDMWANPQDRERYFTTMREQGSVWEQESRFRMKSGEILDGLVSGETFSMGEEMYILTIIRDITTRKQAEDALRSSKMELEEAQRIGKVGSWQWAVATDSITWSSGCYRINGWDPALPPPGYKEHLKIYTEKSAALLENAVAQTLKNGTPYELDLELLDQDGLRRFVTARGEAVRDPAGQVAILRGTLQDITQRKLSEDFASRRNRQLGILTGAGQKINTVLEIPTIMQNLVASAIEITDSTAGSAGMIVNEKMVFSKYYKHGKLIPIDYSFGKGYGVPGLVMETRSPYFSNDAEHDPYVIQEIRKTLRFTNLANVPILDRKGDILGSFQIHNTKGRRPFDQLDIEMLQGLASSAAIAIENARMMDEIRRSEEDKITLSSILDKSLNEIYMFDAQTLRITYVNSGACKNLNYSPEALRSMTPIDLKPELDKKSFHKLIEPLLQHEKNKIMFYTSHRRSDGSLYPVEVHMQLIEKPSRVFLATIIDITERSRMEKDLKLSEEKYRTLYETMAQGVVYHDATGKIISVNPAAQKILGLSINHLMGRTSIDPAWKAIHEDGSSISEKMHPSMIALRTRKTVSDVIMGVFNPGEKQYRWIMVNAVPQFRYAQTKPYQVYSTFDDITNIKQAEEEIQAANMELMTMNRLITATTGILDIDRILETVLDESMKIVGFEGGSICLLNPDETLQLTVHRGLSEAVILDRTANKVKVGECLCGESARFMKPILLPDPGSVEKSNTPSFEKNIRYHAAFPIVTSGKCVGVLCVFTRTDKKLSGKGLKFLETITAQVALSIDNARLYQEGKNYVEKLEKKVAQRTFALQENQMSLLNLVDDMNRTTAELESANKRLLELDLMKSMFIASTSHELRTPLNSIIGFTSILLEGWSGELTPEQKEQVRIVNTSGKHLLSLINDVIDISKIEAGRLEKHASKFNLKEVIDEVVSTLKPELNGKGLLLHVEAEHLDLNTDRKRLLQCLMNLLSNAVKFTERGEIKVRAKSINNEIEISVEDTGIGMKKEDIPKIFYAFVRLDTPLTNKTSGTGLGLYLTQKLAKEVLMGTIAVESEWGKGSIFSLRIPQEVTI